MMTGTSTVSSLLCAPDIKIGTTRRPVDGHLPARVLSLHENIQRVVSRPSSLGKDTGDSAEAGSVHEDRLDIRESCAPFVHLGPALLRSGIPPVCDGGLEAATGTR